MSDVKGTCVTRMVGLALVAVLMLLAGCDDSLTGEAEVSLYASVDAGSAERTESSLSITPSNYVVGLTYFALERDDGIVVPIIESDDPIRYDLSDAVGSLSLFMGKKTIPLGTYTGYRMRFTYLEMDMESSFDVPSWSTDNTHPLVSASRDEEVMVHASHTFRMYFNTDGPYWKRDMVVKSGEDTLTGDPIWSWMHASLEDTDGRRSFFVESETHPIDDLGFINLFDDRDFWQDPADYGNPETLITIVSGSTVGGLDASITPFTVSMDRDLLLTIDILETFNFYETDDGSKYDNGKLDIGPYYDEIPIGTGDLTWYGDHGFHPFMPSYALAPAD